MKANDFFEDGKRYFVEGNLRDSIEAFTKAADGGFEKEISYLSRGAAHLKLKESDEAVSDFSRVVDLDGKNARAFYYRGMAYAQRKDYDKAVDDFTRAIELKPNEGSFLFARGASYMELGKSEEAGEDIRNATNYLEATVQGYVDTIGDRTHLHKVLAILEGERRSETLAVDESEFDAIKAMLMEGAEVEA
jgi:tetratricopeptide (TPR) repeat protein